MSEQDDIRKAFAALLTQQLSIPIAPSVPGTLRTATGYLQCGTPYLSSIDVAATFRRPVMRLSLVLVSPASDWDRAMTWVDDKVDLVRAIPVTALVAGRQCPMFATVDPLGVFDTKSLAFEVVFTPIQLGALS